MLGSILFQTYSVWHRNLEEGLLTQWCKDREGLHKADAEIYARMERQWALRGTYYQVGVFLSNFNPNEAEKHAR